MHNFIYRRYISPNFKFLAFVGLEFFYIQKKFQIERKRKAKKKYRKTASEIRNSIVGAENTSSAASKFEDFILLSQLVFELERFEASIGFSFLACKSVPRDQ